MESKRSGSVVCLTAEKRRFEAYSHQQLARAPPFVVPPVALRRGFQDNEPGFIRPLEESSSRIVALQERAAELAGLADGWIHETAAELSRGGIDLQRQLVGTDR